MVVASRSITFELYTKLFQKAMGLSKTNYTQIHTRARACTYMSTNRLKSNQTDVLISQIYFWNKTLHVSDSSSVHHPEFFTVDTAMIYVIKVC